MTRVFKILIADSKRGDAREALTGHRVDRSICAWFWEQLLSQPDSFKKLGFARNYVPNALPFPNCT
ncbi:hypothetical protein R6Q59_007119 [Mikania micrantha]